MDGHGEAAAQFGVAEQHETEAVLGIHLVIGEESQILEDIWPQVVGFVDDEDGADTRIGAEARDFVLDLAMERGAGAFDGEAHFPRDRFVEVHDVARGERDVDDAIEPGVQAGEDLATGARLPAAAIAGDEADAPQVEQMGEPDIEFATAGGGKEILRRDLGPKGMLREREMFAVHQKSSVSFRNGSPGGG